MDTDRPRPHRCRTLAVVVVAAIALVACQDDGDSRAAFCTAANESERFETTFDALDPDDVPAAIEVFTQARDTEIDLRRNAPEAVRADFDVLVQFLDDLVAGLERVDPSSTERPPIYAEMRTRFDQVEAASARIAGYVDTNC